MGKNLQKCVFMAHRHGPRLMYILQGYQGDIRCGGQIVMRSKPPDTFLLPGSRAAPLTSQCLILHLRSPSPLLICSFSAPHCFNSHTTKKKNAHTRLQRHAGPMPRSTVCSFIACKSANQHLISSSKFDNAIFFFIWLWWTLLYICTPHLTLSFWVFCRYKFWYHFVSRRRYLRTVPVCVQWGWRPSGKDQSNTLLKRTSNSQWIIHHKQDTTWCVWLHTYASTHTCTRTYRVKKWPL